MSKERREISFDCDLSSHKIDYHKIIPKINSIPNPYVGNKKKLLSFIGYVLEKHDIKFDSFFDAFSGSAIVSLFMKNLGKKVISNDALTSSYFHSVALVENFDVKLNDEEIRYILNNNNENASTFVRDYWSSDSEFQLRKRFTQNEAKQLDIIRSNIKDLSLLSSQAIGLSANSLICMRLPFGFVDRSVDIYSHRKKQIKDYGKNSNNHDRRIGIYYDENLDLNFKQWFPKYIKSLQGCITPEEKECNNVKMIHAILLSGIHNFISHSKAFSGGFLNYGQALRDVKNRVENYNELSFDVSKIKDSTFTELSKVSNIRCIATNSDVIELLKTGFVDVDCVYFDPPYGGGMSDYGSIYRFFEEYIYEDFLENLPHYPFLSRFSHKKTYESNFREMLHFSRNIPIWIFSFNESSWNGPEYIINIIKDFKKDIIIETVKYEYKYRKKRQENEYLVIAR
jgi:adenine-specific DNA methylase